MDSEHQGFEADLTELEMSCFTGDYVTGSVSPEYLEWVEANQNS